MTLSSGAFHVPGRQERNRRTPPGSAVASPSVAAAPHPGRLRVRAHLRIHNRTKLTVPCTPRTTADTPGEHAGPPVQIDAN
jgi:hypothetical protein